MASYSTRNFSGGQFIVSAPIALVTGATGGIGAATARRLAVEGFSVVVCARRRERLDRLAREIGGRAVSLDVTDAVSVAALADSVPECAVLVNNTFGALGRTIIGEADERQWRRMYETDMLGTVRVNMALLPALLASGGGHVVILTSITERELYDGAAGYSGAKHAQTAVAETLQREFRGQPVRVCEIAVGMVRAEFSVMRIGDEAAAADAVCKGVEPLQPEDVADCVAWMVSCPPNIDVSYLMVTPLAQSTNNPARRDVPNGRS